MSKRTGLLLTLAAFGLFAHSQRAAAQQNSAINNLGAGKAQSGMVTYNKFFQDRAAVEPNRNTISQTSPSDQLNLRFASSRQEAPSDVQLQPATLSQNVQPPRPPETPALPGKVNSGNAAQGANEQIRFTPQVPPAVNQGMEYRGQNLQRQDIGSTPMITPVPAGTNSATCDAAVNSYFQPGCDTPLRRGAIDNSMYQQSYKNRRPTDYDAHRTFGKNQSAGQSIYEQVTNQFDSSQLNFEDCDSCDTQRATYFGEYTALIGLPYYSDTQSAASITNGGLNRIEPFDYDSVYASRFAAGFETAKGPGGLIEYFNMSANSNLMSIAQPSVATTVTGGLNVPFASPITVSTPTGGRLEANAQQDLSAIRVEAFKRIYWPISTLSGGLGLNYTTFDQRVNYANFVSPTATIANMTLNGQRRFQGIGPTFSMQYHRPIGHTKLAAIGGIQAGLLFGSDDWEVLSDGARVYETHASRVVSTLNVNLGVEYSRSLSDCGNSRLFIRTTIEGQNWLNMGSFASTNSDFGFLSGNLTIGMAY